MRMSMEMSEFWHGFEYVGLPRQMRSYLIGVGKFRHEWPHYTVNFRYSEANFFAPD